MLALYYQFTNLRTTCCNMGASGLKLDFIIKNPSPEPASCWPDLKYVPLSNHMMENITLLKRINHSHSLCLMQWNSWTSLPAVSNVLAARSPLLVRPAARTNSPPAFSLRRVDLKQETGTMKPHWQSKHRQSLDILLHVESSQRATGAKASQVTQIRNNVLYRAWMTVKFLNACVNKILYI